MVAPSIRPWQWPNVLGLDAAVIAMAWLAVFAAHARPSEHPGNFAFLVLGLSVWLTYLADRLFDVNSRPAEALLSKRHQFAKAHSRRLWVFWGLLLLMALALAVGGLKPFQLHAGCWLLIASLLYSLLNQLCSHRFFPKELFVAGLFAAGTQVFRIRPQLDLPVLAFALLCFVNCLAVAERERAVDARLRVHSLAQHLSGRRLAALFGMTCALAAGSELRLALLPSALALALLAYGKHFISGESFRVLCDASLLIGPTLYFVVK